MHSDHHTHESNHTIIDEKSLQDKCLAFLACVVLIGLTGLGLYWQSLSLPTVQEEEKTQK